MSWQLLAAALLIVAAATYLGRQTWRSWTGLKVGGCGGGCSCPKSAATLPGPAEAGAARLISEEEISARLRQRR